MLFATEFPAHPEFEPNTSSIVNNVHIRHVSPLPRDKSQEIKFTPFSSRHNYQYLTGLAFKKVKPTSRCEQKYDINLYITCNRKHNKH